MRQIYGLILAFCWTGLTFSANAQTLDTLNEHLNGCVDYVSEPLSSEGFGYLSGTIDNLPNFSPDMYPGVSSLMVKEHGLIAPVHIPANANVMLKGMWVWLSSGTAIVGQPDVFRLKVYKQIGPNSFTQIASQPFTLQDLTPPLDWPYDINSYPPSGYAYPIANNFISFPGGGLDLAALGVLNEDQLLYSLETKTATSDDTIAFRCTLHHISIPPCSSVSWMVNLGNSNDASALGWTSYSSFMLNFDPETWFEAPMFFPLLETTTVQVCPPPASLTTQYLAPGAALVSWGAVQGAAAYTLQYRKAGGNWLTLNVSSNYYQLTGLSTDATYELKVRAKCINVGAGAYSDVVTFTVSGGQPPCQRPNPVTATAVDMYHLLVKWPPASGALSYELQYRRTVGGAWSPTFSTVNTSYTIGNLTSGTLYSVRARSVCAGDVATLWSPVVTGATVQGSKDGFFDENVHSEPFISLYPNPNTGIFMLNVENFDFNESEGGLPVEIYDLSGKRIISQKIIDSETIFDLSDYAKGLYFVKMLDKTAKVIVE